MRHATSSSTPDVGSRGDARRRPRRRNYRPAPLGRLLLGLAGVVTAAGVGAQPATPGPGDRELERGAMLYRLHCASCHGTGGRGDGPVAPALVVRPANLTELARRAGGKFPHDEVRSAIDGRTELPSHGAREMPVWGLSFGDRGRDDDSQEREVQAEIRALVRYLVTLQRP